MAKFVVFNPRGVAVESLPVIYGFNNGGREGFWEGLLITEDGTMLGQHVCSSEGYMLGDLGIIEGRRPDHHERFQQHYPNGYRMDFVGYDAVGNHAGLQAAFAAHDAKPPSDEAAKES